MEEAKVIWCSVHCQVVCFKCVCAFVNDNLAGGALLVFFRSALVGVCPHGKSRVHVNSAVVCVCVYSCAHVHLEFPFDRQSLNVKMIHLSSRQCQDSLGLLSNWEAVISREAFLHSGLYYSHWLRLPESHLGLLTKSRSPI